MYKKIELTSSTSSEASDSSSRRLITADSDWLLSLEESESENEDLSDFQCLQNNNIQKKYKADASKRASKEQCFASVKDTDDDSGELNQLKSHENGLIDLAEREQESALEGCEKQFGLGLNKQSSALSQAGFSAKKFVLVVICFIGFASFALAIVFRKRIMASITTEKAGAVFFSGICLLGIASVAFTAVTVIDFLSTNVSSPDAQPLDKAMSKVCP